MKHSELLDVESLPWQPVRPDVALGVYGRTLLAGGAKIVLTRVEPGGLFAAHRDDYGHLFYFLSGEGLVWVGEVRSAAYPGLVVRVAAGESHAYQNTGSGDLTLLSANIPAQPDPG